MALENLILGQIMFLVNSRALYLMATNYSWKRKVRVVLVAFDFTRIVFFIGVKKYK